MNTTIKICTLVLALPLLIVSSITAQPLRNPKPEPDTTLNIQYLLNPSFHSLLPVSDDSQIENPFPEQKKVPARFLLGLGSAFLKGTVDEPFNAPNYGLGTPPPLTFIRPENATDYALTLKRINSYTFGSE